MKTFVLDSSVFVHNPQAIFTFKENNLIIPTLTIGSLLTIGRGHGLRAASAREALHQISTVFDSHISPFSSNAEEDIMDEEALDQAYKEMLEEQAKLQDLLDEDCDLDDNDMACYPLHQTISTIPLANQLCCAAVGDGTAFLKCTYDEANMLNVMEEIPDGILVTMDPAQRMLGLSRNIKVEVYRHDRTEQSNGCYDGRSIAYLSSNQLSQFEASQSGIDLPEHLQLYFQDHTTGEEKKRESEYVLSENEFVVLKCRDNQEVEEQFGIYKHGRLVHLRYTDVFPHNAEPRNIGQRFAIEALMTPATEAPLVLLVGEAGTGKTHLSMACGIEQTKKELAYQSIVEIHPQSWSMERAEEYLSTEQAYILIDSCQNYTPYQLKNIISKCAKGTKLVLMGDLEKIDNPYLDRYSCGLTYVADHMKSSPLCWQVTFQKDEYLPSALSEEARRLFVTTPI